MAPADGPGVFCLVARASGAVQVLHVPSMQPLAEFDGVADGPTVARPRGAGAAHATPRPWLAAGLVLLAHAPVCGGVRLFLRLRRAAEEAGSLGAGRGPGQARAGAGAPAAVAATPIRELRMECFGRAPAGNPLAACRQPLLLALLADDGLLAYRAFDAGAGRVCLRRLLLAGARPGRGAAAGGAAGGPSARLVRFDGLGEGDGAAYRRGALLWRSHNPSRPWPAPSAQRGPRPRRLTRAGVPRRAAACSCAASSRSGCSRCAARWSRTPWTSTAPCTASRPSTTSTARGSAPASATR